MVRDSVARPGKVFYSEVRNTVARSLVRDPVARPGKLFWPEVRDTVARSGKLLLFLVRVTVTGTGKVF